MKERFKDASKQARLAIILLAIVLVATVVGLLVSTPRTQAVEQVNGLVFSEICTKNETIIADNDGRYRDYIELYNGGKDINLKGYCLTDGSAKSEPFGDLPLPKDTYCLLFLDKELTGFSLKASGGECVSLMDKAGRIVTQVTTVTSPEDRVMLYTPDGYVISPKATPGFSNDAAGERAFKEGKEDENPVVVISEMLTDNVSVLADDAGRFSDAVELYNRGDKPVFLRNYCLSDDPDNRFRYRLPAVLLGAGEYAVIYCDGENYIGPNGEIHANFGLAAGDTLCLTGSNGDYTTLAVQFPGENRALARNEQGEYVPFDVSLGYANDETGVAAFALSCEDAAAELVISEVLLSNADVPYNGQFVDAVEIWNRSKKEVDTAGWHLSDGGDPYGYALPKQKIAPGERIVIQCTREQTGFALSANEAACLLSPRHKWASRVSCTGSRAGQSVQATETGELAYTLGAVSLGYANTAAGVKEYQKSILPDGLRISELMSANTAYIQGSYGKASDWIELYNGSNKKINLSDYTFSTDSGFLSAYQLPDKTLSPGQYYVILLSERNNGPSGYQRLPVNLSSDGENVYLSRNGEVVDYAIMPQLPTDISYGRAAITGAFTILQTPTPRQANAVAAEVSQTPTTAAAQGVYTTGLEVSLSGKGEIYYTTDATIPTKESIPYTGPVFLGETTVLRAVCFEPGKLPSETLDLTYVIDAGHSLPVMTVVTEPDNLFSEETGIYMKGPNASEVFPHKGANYWQNWERPVTVSLFETDGTGFSLPCGISIFGAYSRALDKKGFSLNFRDAYGAGELEYKLFGEEGLDTYESFNLRCSGQDVSKSHMRDVLMTSLVADHTTVAVQKYRPVVLYLNAEFWGVYYIREKSTENYVAGNYNADFNDVIITGADGIDKPEYKALVEYAHTHDLSVQAHYDYVCSQMDIDNYTDYIIAEMYVANPDNGNIRFFRTTDTKWTWILYDTDYGFSDVKFDTVKDHLRPEGTGAGDAFSTKLINALLGNPDFRENFIRRMAWQMNNIWTEEKVSARIDELESLIKEDMKLDCARWERRYENWQYHVRSLRTFVGERNKVFPQYVQNYFGLSDAQMRQFGFVMQEG